MAKDKNHKRPKGGFDYFLEDETIRRYASLSCEMKLSWLEEAARFTYRVLSRDPARKQIWEDFRKGRI
jgi:hypothetical protein